MKVAVCGLACEICPLMTRGECPNGDEGCMPKMNRMCKISTCAFERGVRYCFQCPDFPCETTKSGPIAYDYCMFISGKLKS
jgi:hypothetical protein